MKKLIAVALLLLLIGVVVHADISQMFVVTKHITKIYTHSFGYRVVYLKNDLSLGEFYVPMSWFDRADGKGVIIRGTDNAYPYFSVFWLDGEFHSVRLYTKDNFAHETWGSLPHRDGLREVFDVEEIDLDL